MLALAESEALTCACGGWLPETTAIENDGRYTTEPMRCHSCDAQAIAQDQHRAAGHERPQAVHWPVPKLRPKRG